MKQITTIIIELFCSILILCAQTPNVHLAFDFPKYKDTLVPYSYALFCNGQRTFQSDELLMENGEFQIEIEIHTPHTLVVLMGKDENTLFSNGSNGGIFIFAGDNLYLTFTDFGFDHITFTGLGSTRFALEKSYKNAINSRVPNEPIRNAIEKIKRANLKAAIADELIAEYNRLLSEQEKPVLLANKYLDIYGLPVYNISKREYDSKDVQFILDTVINNKRIKRLIGLSNEKREYLNFDNSYHNLLKEYAYIKRTLIDKKKYEPHKSIKDDYFTLNTIYKNAENRNYVLGNFIIRSAYRHNLENGLDECFNHYFSNFASDDPLYSKVELLYNRLNSNLTKGATVPNFVLTDSLGNSVNLHDLMGKVVIIDFWFNGCGGCAQITPALEDVKKLYSERKDIIFTSVSIDKYRQSWLKGIGKFTPKNALHLYTNGNGSDTPIIKHFNINAYPTLLILDKNGKVFKGRASRPYPNDNKAKEDLIDEINTALIN